MDIHHVQINSEARVSLAEVFHLCVHWEVPLPYVEYFWGLLPFHDLFGGPEWFGNDHVVEVCGPISNTFA